MEDYCNYKPKNRFWGKVDEIGDVYAIITSKGYAIAQIGGINKDNGTQYCRIFSKLYKEIPENIEQIIKSKENYIVMVHLPSMSRLRKIAPMAQKLGKYSFPDTFKKPEYTRLSLGWKTYGTMNQWIIRVGFTTNHMGVDKWVIEVLKKNKYDESWKEDFLELNPVFAVNGPAIIEMLENGWSLKRWKPTDFDRSSRELWADYNV